MSRIMMFAIIDRKNDIFAEVFDKRLVGRFALPNKKNDIYIFNMFGGMRGRSQNWEGGAKIGRAEP